MKFKPTSRSLLALAALLLGACGDDGGPTGDDPEGFNLRIETAYLVQTAQTRGGTVPLVADRDAYVRVFALSNDSLKDAAPQVRVRLYHGTEEVAVYDLPARSPFVPQRVDQENAVTSWNTKVPGELIQPGLRLLVEVDPDDEIAEVSDSDNCYPAGCTPLDITVHEMPPLRLTIVPVHQTSTGLRGRVTSTNLERFLTLLRKLYPISELEVTLRAPYTTNTPPLNTEGTIWERIVAELEAVRQVEAGDPVYYYGVVNPPYNGGGVVGIANDIPSRTALGWDRFPDAPETMAHELGHNFGRRHAPCGDAGGADPQYPYLQGFVGVYGMDVETAEIKAPFSFTDIMGYCEASWWISDYTFQAVLNYRLQNDGPPSSTSRSSLLVWGRIEDDGIVLEPAFQVDGPGSMPAPRGDYRVEGLDAAGNSLFSYAFAPTTVSDGRPGARNFALRLPVDGDVADRLATLRVTGEGRSASVSANPVEPSESRLRVPDARPPLRRVDAETVELSWDADRNPMVMVRDPATGEVLAFARGGRARVSSRAAELELSYSDGLRSATQRVPVGR
ncbi:MAG TPA: hypothetical protein VF167_03825 [Longimicrobiaceae bacterium]